MTKLFFLLVIGLTTSSLSAQIVAFFGDTSSVSGSTSLPETELSVSWDVINISGTSRQISCKREMLQEVPGSTGRFCWGESCSQVAAGNLTLDEIVTLDAGDTSNTFHGYYRHNGFPGLSIARYIWFDVNAPFNQVQYDVNFCVDYDCALGINNTVNQPKFDIIGNPLSDLSAFSFDFAAAPSNGELVIYDSSGILVERLKISVIRGLIMIDQSKYSSGVYNCLLLDMGRPLGVQRLVVSK